MRLIRTNKGTVSVPLTGARASVQLDNRKRTDRLIITITGTLTVAGGPAGAVRNGGRLSNILSHAVNENGEDTYGPARAYMLRQLAEYDAMSPLAVTALPASANLPVNVYNLYEQYEVGFASRRIVGPSETAFMERDPNSYLYLDTFITPGFNATATLVAPNGGSTITLSNVTVTVEQVYADLAGAAYPFYKPRAREQLSTVSGTNPAEIINVRTQQRLRRVALASEHSVTADGGVLITDDVITATRLIGDGGFNVIGPNQSRWTDLVQSQRAVAGGDSTYEGAAFIADFADHGRLSNTIFPFFQAPNFRFEAAVQISPSSPAGTSRTVQLIEELTRPEASNGWAVVSPELPEWAQSLNG